MSTGDGGWPEKSNRLRRRDFLKVISAVPFLTARALDSPRGTLVNDVHTGWNPAWVDRVERPTTAVEVQSLLKVAKKQGKIISVSGSRHATGGQQFATRSMLVDMRGMNRLLNLDAESGILKIFTPHYSGSEAAIRKAGELYRQLAQAATKRGGSFYLTYNPFRRAEGYGRCQSGVCRVSSVET